MTKKKERSKMGTETSRPLQRTKALTAEAASDAEYAARVIYPFGELSADQPYPREELWFSAALAAIAGAGLHRADVGMAAVGRACAIADRLVVEFEERARQRPPFSKPTKRKRRS